MASAHLPDLPRAHGCYDGGPMCHDSPTALAYCSSGDFAAAFVASADAGDDDAFQPTSTVRLV